MIWEVPSLFCQEAGAGYLCTFGDLTKCENSAKCFLSIKTMICNNEGKFWPLEKSVLKKMLKTLENEDTSYQYKSAYLEKC